MSSESKELVNTPVAPSVAPELPVDGVIVTELELTSGLIGFPLLSIPTPVTLYSHPVLLSIEFMVSVTVEFVSVCVVIDPCVKFGTTGTALAAVP